MILNVKLPEAEYLMYIEGAAMTLDCKRMGTDKKTNAPKTITTTLGFFGPFQLELAFKRIITEELALNQDTIPLREFLKRFKAIEDAIVAQTEKLKIELQELKRK